jgi:hypothetical protein
METLTPGQQRTTAARDALARKFPSPEAKSEFYREIGARGNAGRVVLRAEEATALRDAYRLLASIADRIPDPSESADEQDDDAASA